MRLTELRLWCFTATALSYAALIATSSHSTDPLSPAALTNSVFATGAFNLAAWLMVLTRLPHLANPTPASKTQILTALAITATCALPFAAATATAIATLGLALTRNPTSQPTRHAGILLICLALTTAWPYARPLHVAIANIDSQIVATILTLTGTKVTITSNIVTHNNFSIDILAACASSTPLAGILLAYTETAIYLRAKLSKQDLPFLTASLIASIILTEIRLALMVPSQSSWNYWHNQTGNTLYELAAMTLAISFPALATIPTATRQTSQPQTATPLKP